MKRPAVSNIVAALLLLAVGHAFGQRSVPVQVISVRDTLAAAAYNDRVAELRIERDGFRARLEGVEARPPTVVYVTDTLVSRPDTVIRFVQVDPRGHLNVELLTKRDSLYAPELHATVDVADCDDGFEVSADGVVCDRARLGHLSLAVTASQHPTLGLHWKPSYRSMWEASLGHTGNEWVFAVRRGWRLW